jgi:ABC-type transport system involved in multi-copper enzyme maturation permease subunit
MNISTVAPNTNFTMHLIRKEWRQLIPLIGLLTVLGLVLNVFFLLNPSLGQQGADYVLLGMPGLFAVGAGSLLVGQEKESRTLNWLRSQPIPKSQIVLAKSAIAYTCLALIWVVSFVMHSAFSSIHSSSSNNLLDGILHQLSGWILLMVNSVYLTSCGLALAWRLKSAMSSLFSIIPFAIAPWIVSGVVHDALFQANGRWHDNSPSSLWVSIVLLTIGFVSALLYGWQAALQSLSATPAPRPAKASLFSLASTSSSASWFHRKPQVQSQALIRQFLFQNGIVLGGVSATLFSCAILGASATRSIRPQTSGYLIVLSILVACIATCWLGVLTFHGDKLQQRIRFLADRGVASGRVWRTRQVVPLSILIITSLLLGLGVFIASPRFLHGYGMPFESSSYIAPLAMLAVFAILVCVYAFSQWVSQVLRSPIIAAMIAPAFVGVIITYGVFLSVELQTNGLWLAASSLIPFMATLQLNKLWMDGSESRRFFLQHAAWLTAAVLLPIVPLAYSWATIPSMPTDLRMRLTEIVSQEPAETIRSLVRKDKLDGVTSNTPAIPAKVGDEKPWVRTPASLARRQLEREGHLGYQIKELMRSLVLARLNLDQATSQPFKADYRELFEITLQAAIASRGRPLIIDQNHADRAEFLMLNQLRKPDSMEILGDELWNKTMKNLAAFDQRNKARRRAIALNWHKSRTKRDVNDLGFTYRNPTTKDLLFLDRKMDSRAAHLWAVLHAKDPSELAKAKSAWAQGWANEVAPSDDRANRSLFYAFYPYGEIDLWNGSWEQEAIDLAKSASAPTTAGKAIPIGGKTNE